MPVAHHGLATKTFDNPAKFDDTRKSWLVLWEAGVAIQLPAWTMLLYPSSLFYHFNIDIDGA